MKPAKGLEIHLLTPVWILMSKLPDHINDNENNTLFFSVWSEVLGFDCIEESNFFRIQAFRVHYCSQPAQLSRLADCCPWKLTGIENIGWFRADVCVCAETPSLVIRWMLYNQAATSSTPIRVSSSSPQEFLPLMYVHSSSLFFCRFHSWSIYLPLSAFQIWRFPRDCVRSFKPCMIIRSTELYMFMPVFLLSWPIFKVTGVWKP